MAITPITHLPTQASEMARQKVADATAHARQQANFHSAIVRGDQVTLGIKDEPLALLFQNAIDKLNERLAPALGENAIQNAYNATMDFSPEATAERIVGLSTGFFDAFKARHPGEDETEVRNKFMETIGGGIEQGFAEAREILDGLGVLRGEIADNIDLTYALVQNGLQGFADQFKAAESE